MAPSADEILVAPSKSVIPGQRCAPICQRAAWSISEIARLVRPTSPDANAIHAPEDESGEGQQGDSFDEVVPLQMPEIASVCGRPSSSLHLTECFPQWARSPKAFP